MTDSHTGQAHNGQQRATKGRRKSGTTDHQPDHQAERADGHADATASAANGATGVNVDAAMQRAEATVDVAAQHVGRWAAAFGHGVQRAVARAREEGEDIWAEAQHMRHDRGGAPPEA
ncbi:MAG: hypothetical protein ABI068_06045 [Ktedonobacterales bacterium]